MIGSKEVGDDDDGVVTGKHLGKVNQVSTFKITF